MGHGEVFDAEATGPFGPDARTQGQKLYKPSLFLALGLLLVLPACKRPPEGRFSVTDEDDAQGRVSPFPNPSRS